MMEGGDRGPLDRALARTRAELSPSSADKARLRSALGLPAAAAALGAADSLESGRLELEGAPVAAVAPAAVSALAALRASGKLGASLAALLFGAGVATGWGLRPPAPEAPVSAPPSPVAPVSAPLFVTPPPAAAGGVETESVPEAASPAPQAEQASRRARSPAIAAPPRLPAERLETELALLRRVERALRNGDPAFALALLGELDERFPQTRLGEERLAARTLADCRLDSPEAVARARAFLQSHPRSVYSERIQSACALETNTTGAAH